MSIQHEKQNPLTVAEALNFGISKHRPGTVWQIILSATILVYFLPVLYWLFRDLPSQSLLPPPSSVLKGTLEAISIKCMIATGSVQCWSVFSPTLNHKIYHETAIITFSDGANKIYEFPRMAKQSHFERFRHEKLRKIFGDCIPWPGYENFLPSVARYLALSNSNSANQPTMVVFEMNTNENPKPDPDNWNYRDKLPWHINKIITFVYGVRKSDLSYGKDKNLDPRQNDESRIYEDTMKQGGTI